MMDVKIGTKGFVERGEDEGRYVVIQDDRERTAGYLIFYSRSPNFDDFVFDHWVEDGFLEQVIAARGWEGRWLDVPMTLDPVSNKPMEPSGS